MSQASSFMTREDAEEYTDALGQVVAGGYRQVALGKRLGVPQALGLSVEDWVQARLGGYVRMSIPERRDAVAELTEEGMSTREIGEVLGVNHDTVAEDRKAVGNPTAESDEDALDEAAADAVVGNPTAESEPDSVEPIVAESPPEPSDEERAAEAKRRTEALPDDLATRVRENALPLLEAEAVEAERRERVAAWVDKIRSALSVLSRMVGAPIPTEFEQVLTESERDALSAVLGVIPKGIGE